MVKYLENFKTVRVYFLKRTINVDAATVYTIHSKYVYQEVVRLDTIKFLLSEEILSNLV